MKEVPASIRALALIPGGKDKIVLTLSQANEIGRMFDGIKKEGKVDNPMAIAITNFRRMYKVQNGRWIKRQKDTTEKERLEEKKKKITLSVELVKDMLAQSQLEKEKEAQKARSSQYGISIVVGGHITKPKEYRDIPDAKFADPVNYKYPIDGEHIKPAVSYFNHPGQRTDGKYSIEDWGKVGRRIAAAAGKGYSYKDEKIVTPGTEKSSESNPRVVSISYSGDDYTVVM